MEVPLLPEASWPPAVLARPMHEAAATQTPLRLSLPPGRQSVPIPSYLLALAVGNLESRPLGPISAVWSEPEMVEAGAHEFAGRWNIGRAGMFCCAAGPTAPHLHCMLCRLRRTLRGCASKLVWLPACVAVPCRDCKVPGDGGRNCGPLRLVRRKLIGSTYRTVLECVQQRVRATRLLICQSVAVGVW